MIKTALILAHNRMKETRDVVAAIYPQVDYLLVIDNASEPAVHDWFTREERETYPQMWIVRDMTQPANLPRLWNIGFSQIEMMLYSTHGLNPGPYKVAVLTDDVVIPDGWMDAVCAAMDRTGAAAGCSSPWGGRLVQELLKVEPDADIMNRMYGPAFVIRGEADLKADEALKWWWNDTDLDWQARGAGGMVVVPTHPVVNLYPNASTVGENAEQAGRDREEFGAKWGWNPW